MDFVNVNKTLLSLFIAVLIVLGVVVISNELKRGQFIGLNISQLRTIPFSGEGKAFAVPDLAQVALSVVSDNFDLKQAQTDNTKKMNAVLAMLDSQSIAKADRQTSQYSIAPQYDWTQNGQRFKGYEVSQTVEVKIRDFSKISAILAGAVSAGANQVGGLSFTVENKDAVQAEARDKAIKEAKAKAQTLSQQLGIHLGAIVDFSEGGNVPMPRPLYAADMMAKGGSAPAPQIESGQNEFDSNVTITYQIQ